MDKFLIQGGRPLRGTIRISGAKNAALPIIIAALLATEKVDITNVPDLQDVNTTIKLLKQMGLNLNFQNNQLSLLPSLITNTTAPYELVKTMRASILVLGPLLARYGKADVSLPGGCAIGTRPVDLHIKGLRAMGAEIDVENGYIKARTHGRLRGATILFDKVTVTGTENILMAAVLAEGTTVIENAACEPEVTDLAHFLNVLGAKIAGIGSRTLVVQGVSALGGGTYRILPDRIEAGTYLVAAAMSRGQITLEDVKAEDMTSILQLLQEAGASIHISQDTITLDMHGARPKAITAVTAPYPGFPTDMQAQFLAMNMVAAGNGSITETIFENRFMHVPELQRMGASVLLNEKTAFTQGQETLSGATVMATDLRASASLILAGVVAQGETIIDRIYHVDRGYEKIEEKLRNLGVTIQRLKGKDAKPQNNTAVSG